VPEISDRLEIAQSDYLAAKYPHIAIFQGSYGASRTRTGDLLGAMRPICMLKASENMPISSAFAIPDGGRMRRIGGDIRRFPLDSGTLGG
jgi:hypothetical protein